MVEYNLMNSSEELSKKFIDDNILGGIIQRCPRGGCLVEKIAGCNYIECRCGAKFCWNCKKLKGSGDGECKYGSECNSH